MMLIEETKVPSVNLPLAQFKAHLRLGSGFAEDHVQDDLVEGFLRAAMAAIEARTGKVLLAREMAWRWDQWSGAVQALPVAPAHAIATVELVGQAGDVTVVDPARYQLVPDAQSPSLVALSTALPIIPPGGHVRVRALVGFGPDWSDLPADLAHAVILLAAHYYEYRHEVQYDGGCMPFGVSALIERHRAVRMTAGGRG